MDLPGQSPTAPAAKAVFIRAPAITRAGPGVNVLARVMARPSAMALSSLRRNGEDSGEQEAGMSLLGVAASEEPWDVIVAVRQGNILASAFHPEFTQDTSWHKYFSEITSEFKAERER